jgi:hypothetical protein
MTSLAPGQFTIFVGDRLSARGDLLVVSKAARRLNAGEYLVLSDETGRPFDLDLRGSATEIAARYRPGPEMGGRRRGRPKLGVTAREVTLLPRHWDWLATQPGGASATLRRLVEEARRAHADTDAARRAQERTYRAMTELAGNFADYEEAARALFRDDRASFDALIGLWPQDVQSYLRELWREV